MERLVIPTLGGPAPAATAKGARRLPWLLPLLLLAGCASVPEGANPLAQWHGSPNHSARQPRAIVIHHTAMDSAEGAIHVLQTANSGGPVSAHYVIGEDGRIHQLVTEDRSAWHAGGSRWGGVDDLNAWSIGIELDNDGREPFSVAQIEALLVLLDDLVGRFGIRPHMVLGHGDIAPTRKDDPSVHFPWRHLAAHGYGLWPRDPLPPAPAGFDSWAALATIGYDLRDPEAALAAFHRRYRASEERAWLPGDEAILHDLQQQLLELAGAVPAAAAPAP